MAEEKEEDRGKEEKKEGEKIIYVWPSTQLIFECAVCKKIYKESGMCQACHVLLKPKGE